MVLITFWLVLVPIMFGVRLIELFDDIRGFSLSIGVFVIWFLLGKIMNLISNSKKIKEQLGWKPKIDFYDGLRDTINWYIDNEIIWKKIQEDNYSGERIGLR